MSTMQYIFHLPIYSIAIVIYLGAAPPISNSHHQDYFGKILYNQFLVFSGSLLTLLFHSYRVGEHPNIHQTCEPEAQQVGFCFRRWGMGWEGERGEVRHMGVQECRWNMQILAEIWVLKSHHAELSKVPGLEFQRLHHLWQKFSTTIQV